MAALLHIESESKTKMMKNCGINLKPLLILSLAYMYYLVPKEIIINSIGGWTLKVC